MSAKKDFFFQKGLQKVISSAILNNLIKFKRKKNELLCLTDQKDEQKQFCSFCSRLLLKPAITYLQMKPVLINE